MRFVPSKFPANASPDDKAKILNQSLQNLANDYIRHSHDPNVADLKKRTHFKNLDADSIDGHDWSEIGRETLTRDLLEVTNGYVELGNIPFVADSNEAVDLLVDLNCAEASWEMDNCYHVVAAKNATGGAWKRCRPIRTSDPSVTEFGLEVMVDNTAVYLRAVYYKT